MPVVPLHALEGAAPILATALDSNPQVHIPPLRAAGEAVLALAAKESHYEFARCIGRGGMAEVWLVHRIGARGFRKRFALKRMLPALSEDAGLHNMFVQEARVAASLDHPNVIQAVDFGDSEQGLYLTMEYVDGVSMRDILQFYRDTGLRPPLGLCLCLASQAAEALAYVHQATDALGRPMQLVHRDVTPANLLIDRTGQLKLTDFGIALTGMGAQLGGRSRVVGSLPYMSPEQLNGEELTGASDVYALAVVMVELLCGKRLYGSQRELADAAEARRRPPERIEALLHGRPAALIALLIEAMNLAPGGRPSSLSFGKRLESIRHACTDAGASRNQLANLVAEIRECRGQGRGGHGRLPVRASGTIEIATVAFRRSKRAILRRRARSAVRSCAELWRSHRVSVFCAAFGALLAMSLFFALRVPSSAPSPPPGLARPTQALEPATASAHRQRPRGAHP